jgi:hypothetical protein
MTKYDSKENSLHIGTDNNDFYWTTFIQPLLQHFWCRKTHRNYEYVATFLPQHFY